MIPSVKLDFSHVQAKCGSLDKIQHAAGGGNVSDSAEKAHAHIQKNPHFHQPIHSGMNVFVNYS